MKKQKVIAMKKMIQDKHLDFDKMGICNFDPNPSP